MNRLILATKNLSDKRKIQMRFNFTHKEVGISSNSTKRSVFQKAVLHQSFFFQLQAKTMKSTCESVPIQLSLSQGYNLSTGFEHRCCFVKYLRTIGAEQLFCKISVDGYLWFKFLAPAPSRVSNVQIQRIHFLIRYRLIPFVSALGEFHFL